MVLDRPRREVQGRADLGVGQTGADEPSVEDEAPLFTGQRHEERRKPGMFSSLFGGRKPYEPQPIDRRPQASLPQRGAPALPTRGNTAQAVQIEEEELPGPQEDLDIPSFLRRLAN